MAIEDYLKECTQTKANICFDCENACGGCSWSEVDPDTGIIRFELPEGCVAYPAKIYRNQNGGGKIQTYRIVYCPLFVKTPERKTRNLERYSEYMKSYTEEY